MKLFLCSNDKVSSTGAGFTPLNEEMVENFAAGLSTLRPFSILKRRCLSFRFIWLKKKINFSQKEMKKIV